jgi:hypothetical protein
VNLVPPLASVGTRVDISEFPPADSVAVDPRLADPVKLLRSGTFDLPIEMLARTNVPSGAIGKVTLPLYKGAVNTPSGQRPAWYVILDASTQAEADRLGANLQNANPFEWTKEAIVRGYRGQVTEEFRILQLARAGYITGWTVGLSAARAS